MALEFQLGADIVGTATAPSESNLIKLAAERRLEQDRPLRPKP